MYRALTITFVVLCTALAWWALELQGKLVFKEKELTELRKARAAALEAGRQGKAENTALLENVERLRKERDAVRGEAPEAAAPTDAEASGASSASELIEQSAKLMIAPEVKAIMRAQLLAASRKTYGELFKRWNLSNEETEAVLRALIDRDTSGFSTDISTLPYAVSDNTSIAPIVESFAKERAVADEKLETVLGAERMKELAAYDDEVEREYVVSRYAEQLDIAGSSLNPQQRTQLVDLIRKENSGVGFSAFDGGDLSEAAIAKSSRSREIIQARVIRDATTFLSPDQVNGLQSAFREEIEQVEDHLKFMRESFRPIPSITQGNREK